jgi:hypothetical protein
MKKIILIISTFVLAVIILLFYNYKDYLPPRTPMKIARVESGLEIPQNIQIIDFKEEYSFTGEGYVFVLMKFNDIALDDVMHECINKRYKKISIENLMIDKLINPNNKDYGFVINSKKITTINDGYYKLNAKDLNKRDFSIVIIDKKKKELIVYVSFP